MDRAIRPKTLADYVGQPAVREQIVKLRPQWHSDRDDEQSQQSQVPMFFQRRHDVFPPRSEMIGCGMCGLRPSSPTRGLERSIPILLLND